MKLYLSFSVILLAGLSMLSCSAQTSQKGGSDEVNGEAIHVYYFHFTARCETCNAIEEETKTALASSYKDMMTEGAIEFMALNLDEEPGKEMSEKLRVSGQALLIVKGETRIDLTSEGFLNARTNPEKFHAILISRIEELL